MKVVVFGAGGIVGQEMIASVPVGIDAVFTRRENSSNCIGVKLDNYDTIYSFLDVVKPDVVINLSGTNEVDAVEKLSKGDKDNFWPCQFVNMFAPFHMARWCDTNGSFFIQCSTQAVFSGNNPPYSPSSEPDPINVYGEQKAEAESLVSAFDETLIARLTFVYGIRPDRTIGRSNPLESMMSPERQLQVDDRWFSPLWSKDASRALWDLAIAKDPGIIHLGEPIKISRYDLAARCAWDTMRSIDIRPVSHEFFKGIAERPENTTWAKGSLYYTPLSEAIELSYLEWKNV